MWQNFLVALNAVVPFVIYLAVGALAVRIRLADVEFMNRLNKFTFKLFFPLLMFKNVYNATPESMPSLTLILFTVIGILGWAESRSAQHPDQSQRACRVL